MEVANKLDLESFHHKKEMCVCDRTDVLGDAPMIIEKSQINMLDLLNVACWLHLSKTVE